MKKKIKLDITCQDISFPAILVISDEVPSDDSFLHSKEKALITDCQSEKRSREFLHGRSLAKAALADFYPKAAADLAILPGVFGQPCVAYDGPMHYEIGITHSHGLAAALAFPSTCPMSVDNELIDPKRSSTILSVLTPDEKIVCNSLPVPLDGKYTILWTARECLAKALRCSPGLRSPVLAVRDARDTDTYKTIKVNYENFGQYRSLVCRVGDFYTCILLPFEAEIVNEEEVFGSLTGLYK